VSSGATGGFNAGGVAIAGIGNLAIFEGVANTPAAAVHTPARRSCQASAGSSV
jgi:hypothetical protein